MARSSSSTNRTRRDRRGPEPDPPAPPPSRGEAFSGARLQSDLTAIGLCLVGVLVGLALIRPGSTGWLGGGITSSLRFWIGHGVYAAPLLLLAAGVALIWDYRRATSAQLLLGLSAGVLFVLGWVHLLSAPPGEPFASSTARFDSTFGKPHAVELLHHADGGFIGAVVVWALTPLERWGSMVTLGALGIASALLLSEMTLRGFLERTHERSRIAGERFRAHAELLRQRAGVEGSDRFSMVRAGQREGEGLFLDVDGPAAEAGAAPGEEAGDAGGAREPRRKSRSFRRAPTEEAEPVPAPSPPILAALNEATPESAGAALPTAEELGIAWPQSAAPAEEASVVRSAEEPPPAVEPRRERQRETRREPRAEAEPAARPRREEPRIRAPRAASQPLPAADDYVFPPVTLLDLPQPRPKKAQAEAEANISILENTLAQFRIQAQVVEIADGPTVTRYEIRLGEGIRVRKILDLADNIAMSLAAMSVRVEAPIPGKAAIGIEVPKKQSAIVTLRECLESDEFLRMDSTVGFVLGKDIAGNVRCADLARMPHLLVAGATNSGKSVCLNVLIASMLFRARPQDLKLIMIDPKRVELTLFEGIPHLVHPVIKDVKQAAGILRWVLKEMDRRYDLFSAVMTRNIQGYNEKMAAKPEEKLPYLMVVVDELADLMMQQGAEVEQLICRLAQLARATGIHLVLATQRPSVDVITGLIKANVPSRVSFAVTSQVDSRTILDAKGAESLIGRGDMLFKPVDAPKPSRVQGAYLREAEVEAIVAHLKTQGKPEYIAEALSVDHGAYGVASEEEVEDDLFEPAARFVVTTGHASTSMIQRKFKIGYTRAGRLVDLMESRGIVGALDGARPREILKTRMQLDDMFQSVRSSPFRSFDPDEEEAEEEFEVGLTEPETDADGDPFRDD